MSTERITAIHDLAEALGAALAQWDGRDHPADQARRPAGWQRGCRGDRRMLRDLYMLRGRLVREISEADASAMARLRRCWATAGEAVAALTCDRLIRAAIATIASARGCVRRAVLWWSATTVAA